MSVFDVELDRMVQCNAKAAEMFGVSREALLETGPQQYFLADQPDGMPPAESEKDYTRRALAGEVVQFQRAIQNQHGDFLYCEVLLVHLPFKNRKLLRESFIDISDRKNLENQLRQAEKMQAIGQLAGGGRPRFQQSTCQHSWLFGDAAQPAG